MSNNRHAPHCAVQLNYGGLVLHIIILLDPEPDLATSYRVTCTERETGRILGSTLLQARPEGGPPALSLWDIAPLLGDPYRLASALVEIESERLARLNRRAADRQRRFNRSWLRRTRLLFPLPLALKPNLLVHLESRVQR
jgi:hypothetical protein